MSKSVNLTIRIEPELKAEAEAACAYLDTTVSAVIRKALRDAIRNYQAARAQDTRYSREFFEGERAQLAHDLLASHIEAAGGVAVIDEENGRQVVRPAPPDTHLAKPAKDAAAPRLTESGDIDPRTMSRQLRRQYERDKRKGRL